MDPSSEEDRAVIDDSLRQLAAFNGQEEQRKQGRVSRAWEWVGLALGIAWAAAVGGIVIRADHAIVSELAAVHGVLTVALGTMWWHRKLTAVRSDGPPPVDADAEDGSDADVG